jgi:hypothetical protein
MFDRVSYSTRPRDALVSHRRGLQALVSAAAPMAAERRLPVTGCATEDAVVQRMEGSGQLQRGCAAGWKRAEWHTRADRHRGLARPGPSASVFPPQNHMYAHVHVRARVCLCVCVSQGPQVEGLRDARVAAL